MVKQDAGELKVDTFSPRCRADQDTRPLWAPKSTFSRNFCSVIPTFEHFHTRFWKFTIDGVLQRVYATQIRGENDDLLRWVDPATPTSDPLALLESLRRCADRIHVFCQAGQIKVPPANQRLLMYLEHMVIEVEPPAAQQGRSGVFHPKVWIIRYVDDTDSVSYRLLCLSRNLTFDRSWDTVLVLDGQLTDRQNAYSVNRPLVEFISALPSMAIRKNAVSRQAAKDIKTIESELRVVLWDTTSLDVDEIQFVPLGLTGKRQWPFPRRIDQLLVMSPFVTDGFLKTFENKQRTKHLISRTETMQALDSSRLQEHWNCFTLDEALEVTRNIDEPNTSPEQQELSGLHAKVFVVDEGWKAHLWTGSANATTAAFDGNVEFLVRLTGKKSKLGVNAFLEEKKDGTNLKSLLMEYIPQSDAIVSNEVQQQLEKMLDACCTAIATLPMCVRISKTAEDENGFITNVECGQLLKPVEDVSIVCRPAMLSANSARPVPLNVPFQLSFGPHAAESISSFVAFEVVASLADINQKCSFVLNLPLVGAPSDRREQLLQSLMKDTKTLLRFLMLLLSDDPESLMKELLHAGLQSHSDKNHNSEDSFPLLEQMLLALQNSPEKLLQIQRLIEDLSRNAEGRSILPEDFQTIWEPIQRVAATMQKSSGRRGAKQ